jgi:hypothetical protein
MRQTTLEKMSTDELEEYNELLKLKENLQKLETNRQNAVIENLNKMGVTNVSPDKFRTEMEAVGYKMFNEIKADINCTHRDKYSGNKSYEQLVQDLKAGVYKKTD